MRILLAVLVALGLHAAAAGAEPPRNPALANSTWPIFHQSGYAQASGPFPAPRGGSPVLVQRLDTPEGGVSPWTVLAAPYRDGSQAAFGTIQTGVVKWLLDGERFEQTSYVPLPRGRFDFDWNIAVLRTGEVVVTSKRENAFYLLADERPDCPRCRLIVTRRFQVPAALGGLTTHFSVSYDGHLIALLDNHRLAAISLQTGDVVAHHDRALQSGDYGQHNAFAIDETGRIYIASQQTLAAIDWTGRGFRQAWEATYDFRGPGCRPPRRSGRVRELLRVARGQTCTGSGVTPTLIGSRDTGLVILVDGHQPSNNLLAFWRDRIPDDWVGTPGQDRRLAGRLALPLSTPLGEGFTAENSPAAVGNSIFVAQWAGFRPDCDPPKGVQRVDWRPSQRRLELVWANPEVHFNGVPTVSSATGLVYGSGRGAGCAYAYRGLDVNTGAIVLDVPLGAAENLLDQGNQQTITADGSILVAVRRGVLRVR